VAAVFLWLFVVFVRQVGRADERRVPPWRKLWRPHGDPARAARAFLLISLTPLWSMTMIILSNPQRTSFMVKLVAVTLVLVLGILGAVGHLITPAFIGGYHDPHTITAHQTLRFVPNDRDGYDVTSVPFDFEDDLGTKLALGDQQVSLNFDFPYYGRAWREVYLLQRIRGI
jgi:hypothetical protein